MLSDSSLDWKWNEQIYCFKAEVLCFLLNPTFLLEKRKRISSSWLPPQQGEAVTAELIMLCSPLVPAELLCAFTVQGLCLPSGTWCSCSVRSCWSIVQPQEIKGKIGVVVLVDVTNNWRCGWETGLFFLAMARRWFYLLCSSGAQTGYSHSRVNSPHPPVLLFQRCCLCGRINKELATSEMSVTDSWLSLWISGPGYSLKFLWVIYFWGCC